MLITEYFQDSLISEVKEGFICESEVVTHGQTTKKSDLIRHLSEKKIGLEEQDWIQHTRSLFIDILASGETIKVETVINLYKIFFIQFLKVM